MELSFRPALQSADTSTTARILLTQKKHDTTQTSTGPLVLTLPTAANMPPTSVFILFPPQGPLEARL